MGISRHIRREEETRKDYLSSTHTVDLEVVSGTWYSIFCLYSSLSHPTSTPGLCDCSRTRHLTR